MANSNRRHRLYHNNGDGTFTDIAGSAGIIEEDAAAVAVADFNGDGWQDVVTGAFTPTRLMLNDGGTNHWLKVQARGVSANYFGVGARVEVYSGGMRQVREIRAGDSFCSQNDLLTAHFGLGSQTLADSVIVRWPGGGRDKITAVAADQTITVVQNNGLNQPPSAVRLLEPYHNEVIDESAGEVLFRWQEAQNPATEPLHYNLHLTGWHFDTTFVNIQDTFIAIEKNLLLENQVYLWRVDASDGFSRTASHDVFTIFPASGSILGTVANKSGDPVPGMIFYLTTHNHFMKDTTILTAVTDQNGEYRFENLPASDGAWIAYDSLYSEQAFPYPALLVENLSLQPGQSLVANFILRPADLLLVNGDPNAAFQEEFTTAVRKYGATFFEWITRDDGEAVPVSSLNRLSNPVIVWFSGTAESAIIANETQNSLMMFLDQGGKLLLTGQNIVEFLHGQSSVLMQDYLHVSFAGNLNGPTLLTPAANNPVTGGLSSFQVIQTSRDVLLPDASGVAQPALTYDTGDAAGVSLENSGSGYRAVVLGFGIERINLPSARNALMDAVLDWFDVDTAPQPVLTTIPENFELLQNYPNPFNPGTRIDFRLPRQAEVEIKIYNVLGQEISTLVNRKFSVGLHTITWDGRNSADLPVSSGIYIYRLSAKSGGQLLFTDSRRMVLLK